MSELLLLALTAAGLLGRPQATVIVDLPGFVVERPAKLCRIADPWLCPGEPLLLVNGRPIYPPADWTGVVRPEVTR